MDITQLRYFLVTAETLNYTKAAEQLYMSRQALRQALGFMEEELGTPLFFNDRNKLSLTVEGEYLQLSARKVVEEFEKMMVDVKLFSQGQASVKVGLSVSLFPFMMPEIKDILHQFQKKYPQIRVESSMMTNDELIQAVQSGQVDCGALIQMKCERSGLTMQALAEYPVIMSMGEQHRKDHERNISLEELVQYSCIGMGRMDETMKPLHETCEKRNLLLTYEIVPNTIDAFYRVTHSDVLAFDVLLDQTPTIGNVYERFLEGYSWEVGVLYLKSSLEKKEIQLWRRFVEEEYRRVLLKKQER